MAQSDTLIRLTTAEIIPASKVIARAFFNDPVSSYFFPEPEERAKKLRYACEFIIRYAVLFGKAYAISSNLEGIAAWVPSEKSNKTVLRMIRSKAAYTARKVGWKIAKRQMSIENFIHKLHKRHAPFGHMYLDPVAVDPDFQGKGYAGRLLRAMFSRVDEDNLPVYLYTNLERNVALYEHFGFNIVEETILPGTAIHHWSMLRKPKPGDRE